MVLAYPSKVSTVMWINSICSRTGLASSIVNPNASSVNTANLGAHAQSERPCVVQTGELGLASN